MDALAVVMMGAGVFLLWFAYKNPPGGPLALVGTVIKPQGRTPQAAG